MVDQDILLKEKKKPLAEIKVNSAFVIEAESLIKCYSDMVSII